jgi:ubiquinone/menaquinone biosynthesis C-methylase UbiE
MVNKPDYSQASKHYDAARRADKPHVSWWINKLLDAGNLCSGKRLLDLGCGTGRWTIPLVEKSGCEAIGIDTSSAMLGQARAKDVTGRIEWRLGDAHSPDVSEASFDCVLMSYVLHHLHDPLQSFRAVFSALKPGGAFLLRQPTLDQIIDDPAHRFFPEAVTIDRQRMPFGAEITDWLKKTGFERVAVEPVRMKTNNSPQDWLLEVKPRVCSTFHLMSDEAFANGLALLREYIVAHPDDPWLMEDSMSLFSAYKPKT